MELSYDEEEVQEEEREIANSPVLVADKHSDDEALSYIAGCITKKVLTFNIDICISRQDINFSVCFSLGIRVPHSQAGQLSRATED